MIYSAEHGVVVYRVENPLQICAAITGAKQVNGSLVAVPANLFALQLARVVGLPVPQIMDLAYDWPAHGIAPYAHQKHMANFMALHPRAFNLGDMGVGKTLATLWAADYLMREGAIKRALIISPLSTLKRVWDDEINRHFMGRRSSIILHGDRDIRARALDTHKDFYIINHDGLGIGSRRGHRGLEIGALATRIKDRTDIGLVIVDEASAYKDGNTLRYKILKRVVEEKPYLWCLSGTPTPNAPTDAWSLGRLVGGVTENFQSFRSRTMYQMGQFKWLPQRGAAEVVAKALSPSIRYNRADCIDLPECVYETRDVEMSATQKVAYAEFKKNLVLTMKSGAQITAVNEAVLRMKLIQISLGAIYGPDREIHRTDCAPRLEVLKEVINEAGGKILVFAPLTSVVNLVYSELKATYGEESIARVYGATTQKARSEIFRAFEQESVPRIIVADPGTMSHGLNLPAANTIVWFGPTDRPETYQQANDRISRPGQKRKMLIVRLASTAIEREIFRRLADKASMQGAILALAEEGK